MKPQEKLFHAADEMLNTGAEKQIAGTGTETAGHPANSI